jgi:hypothetical protein
VFGFSGGPQQPFEFLNMEDNKTLENLTKNAVLFYLVDLFRNSHTAYAVSNLPSEDYLRITHQRMVEIVQRLVRNNFRIIGSVSDGEFDV